MIDPPRSREQRRADTLHEVCLQSNYAQATAVALVHTIVNKHANAVHLCLNQF